MKEIHAFISNKTLLRALAEIPNNPKLPQTVKMPCFDVARWVLISYINLVGANNISRLHNVRRRSPVWTSWGMLSTYYYILERFSVRSSGAYEIQSDHHTMLTDLCEYLNSSFTCNGWYCVRA